MISVRSAGERGHTDHGWLNSHHTFAFGEYYDAEHVGFSKLRVINEDRIAGGTGFATHGHRNMEIISYVVEGALEHKDSMGNSVIIRPGEVQRMSAGTGVKHSEQNYLKDRATHFLQIWITPDEEEMAPSYAQRSFENDFGGSDLVLVVSRRGRDNSVTIHQDVDIYAAKAIEAGEKHLKVSAGRHIWVQVIKGNVTIGEATDLRPGDGARVTNVESLVLHWTGGAEFLVFDLP